MRILNMTGKALTELQLEELEISFGPDNEIVDASPKVLSDGTYEGYKKNLKQIASDYDNVIVSLPLEFYLRAAYEIGADSSDSKWLLDLIVPIKDLEGRHCYFVNFRGERRVCTIIEEK